MALVSKYTLEEVLGPLNEIERKHAPKTLYVAGDLSLLDARRVSVVGTRYPSCEGAKQATALAEALVGRSIVVVSGLAEGVDTIAHTTALRCGGRTIAVLGAPLDTFYPARNRELQLTIMREHLAVSQFPPGTPIQRKNFPMRNRTMALLTDATIIVEAGESSGTLHQGWEALRLGRLLFLVEPLLEREDLKWPREMLRYGAQVLCNENLDAVLEALPERSREELAL